MTAAVWKRGFVAGCVAAPAVWAANGAWPGVQVFGVESAAVVGALTAAAVFGFLSWRPVGRRLAALWPDYPRFLDAVLERPDKSGLSPYGAGQCFVGRGAAMNRLVAATRDEQQPGLRWMQVYGGAGLGKTRIGLEWLKALRARGWEVGVLRPETTVAAMADAVFRRRPLAILIDDADHHPQLWAKLDALAARPWRTPVRVLLTTAAAVEPPIRLDPAVRDRLVEAEEPELRRGVAAVRLRRPDIAVFIEYPDGAAARSGRAGGAASNAERLATVAGGRPLFARLLLQNPGAENPWRVLAEQADGLLQAAVRAFGPRGADLLALAALAGPFPLADTARLFEKPLKPGRLKKFFPQASETELATMVPAVRPGLLGMEIALRVMSGRDHWARARLGGLAFEFNRKTAALRFAAIEAERPEMMALFEREAAAAHEEAVAAGIADPLGAEEPPADDDDGSLD